MKKTLIALAIAAVSVPAMATEYYAIATGGPKGAYYAGGVQMAKAMNDHNQMMGNTDEVWVAVPANGGLAGGFQAAGGAKVKAKVNGEFVEATVRMAFMQTDTYAFIGLQHSDKAANLNFVGALGQECVFTAYKPKSKVEDLGDLQKAGTGYMGVGKKGSGMATSLEFAKHLEKDMKSVQPIYASTVRALNAMSAGQAINGNVPDAVAWVISPKKVGGEPFATAARLGLKIEDYDDWDFNDKMPILNNTPAYKFSKVKLPLQGNSKVTTACMDSIAVSGPGVDIDFVVESAGHLFGGLI